MIGCPGATIVLHQPLLPVGCALVWRASNGLDGVDSLSDPRLQGRRIGSRRPPPGNVMARLGLIRHEPYPLMVDRRYDSPGGAISDIDPAISGGCCGGRSRIFRRQRRRKLSVVPLLKAGTRRPTASPLACAIRRTIGNVNNVVIAGGKPISMPCCWNSRHCSTASISSAAETIAAGGLDREIRQSFMRARISPELEQPLFDQHRHLAGERKRLRRSEKDADIQL